MQKKVLKILVKAVLKFKKRLKTSELVELNEAVKKIIKIMK